MYVRMRIQSNACVCMYACMYNWIRDTYCIKFLCMCIRIYTHVYTYHTNIHKHTHLYIQVWICRPKRTTFRGKMGSLHNCHFAVKTWRKRYTTRWLWEKCCRHGQSWRAHVSCVCVRVCVCVCVCMCLYMCAREHTYTKDDYGKLRVWRRRVGMAQAARCV